MNPDVFNMELRRWFGPDIGISATRIESERDLYPEEAALITNAVPHRRAEFSTGRWCARQALQALSVPPTAIPMGDRRGPIWPKGTIGSITHDAGICIAIAARNTSFTALGIDLLETARAETIVESAASILNARGDDLEQPAALRFSSKESVIKAVSTRVNRWLDFTEIRVGFTPTSFEAIISGQPPISGHWASLGPFLLTAAFIPKLHPGA